MPFPSKRSSDTSPIPATGSRQKSATNNDTHLRNVTGAAPWNVLYCPNCVHPTLADKNSVRRHERYQWALCLVCPTCCGTWTICSECARQRIPLLTSSAEYSHQYRKHHQSRIEEDGSDHVPWFPIQHGYELDSSSMDHHVLATAANTPVIRKLQSMILPGPPTFNYTSAHNKNYFKKENKGGLGQAYLVGQSQFKLGVVGEHMATDEVELHMNIAALVSAITTGQRDKLAVILQQVVSVTRRQCLDKSSASHWVTRVPVNSAELRSMYVEGKHAVLPNLPRPPVQVIGDHAYVSLKDCISDLLGHGMELDCIERVQQGTVVRRISESLRAQRILDNSERLHHGGKVMTLYITEWSDGFEPSLSIKGNRGSCWVKTVTIAPPPNKLHSLSHTYPIALGHDSDNHEEVEERFAEELLSIGRGDAMDFYHGALKRNVRVHLELFVSLQDQPERRSANYIMLGTSRYTARWGLALDFVAVASGIPACNNCLASLMRNPLDGHAAMRCTECVNWDTDAQSGLLDFLPPIHYPRNLVPTSGKLSPKRLTYEVMKGAVQTAHDGFVDGGWSTNNVKDFLRVHGLNSEAVTAITLHAINCRNYNSLSNESDGGTAGPELAAMERVRARKPELFQMWKFPSLWVRGVQLNQHIDVAMHLIFLGVIKTTIQMIQQWTKERGKHSAFLQYSKGTFESVQKLGLDWCRCVPYKSGKLGG
jgi:hypothetical protein